MEADDELVVGCWINGGEDRGRARHGDGGFGCREYRHGFALDCGLCESSLYEGMEVKETDEA
jgi:hypothetical protein